MENIYINEHLLASWLWTSDPHFLPWFMSLAYASDDNGYIEIDKTYAKKIETNPTFFKRFLAELGKSDAAEVTKDGETYKIQFKDCEYFKIGKR